MSLIGLKCNEISYNDNEISLHFKPVRLIFMNYSVYLPQILLFTCDLMVA